MDGTKIKVFFPYVASNFEVIPSEEYVYSGGGASAFVSGFGAVPIGCGVSFFPSFPPLSLFSCLFFATIGAKAYLFYLSTPYGGRVHRGVGT